MYLYSFSLIVLNVLVLIISAQKVPPGVPPQRYQQPPPPQYQPQVPQQQYQQHQVPQQQYQQPPPQQQHYQQPPPQQYQQQQQYQQVPQQVPVPQQNVPVQQQQHHDHHHNHDQPQQLLNAANVVQEKDHIAEHMDVPIDTSKMSEQELQFHYFKMHDADNNNKLDGCELIKSLIHWHDGDDSAKSLSDEAISDYVDEFLTRIDPDNDGYISYVEYRKYVDTVKTQ
uniref:Probable serine/threonine-protein kinase DDB_G0280133 n=1 Tax=Diabrotica virgifera virgifera TaxID=50390 RepID=A0A6P7FAI3_DIAVI